MEAGMALRSTSDMRRLWGPACSSAAQAGRVTLWTGFVIVVHRATTEAWKALDSVLKLYGYRPGAPYTGAFSCRKITGGSGYSLHAYGIALDINSQSNPYGSRLITNMPRAMVEAIEAIKTKNGARVFRWGGDWNDNEQLDDSNYDAMHFELQASPAELSHGIDWNTVPSGSPVEERTPAVSILRRHRDNAQLLSFHDRVYRVPNSTSVFEDESTTDITVVDDETWDDISADLSKRGKLAGD
jgi:hypothetical protein